MLTTKKALRSALILFGFIFFHLNSFSQNTVTGKIVNKADNQPVIGATIKVEGGKSATQTKEDGSFSITANKAIAELVISAVGYETLKLPVHGNANLNSISLTLSSTTLNDIVVTGYSAQRKKDLTGSVAVVSVSSMKEIPAGNPENMLQGQASGVTVVTSGSPGVFSDLKIRGITSLGSVAPLVVIDGVESINGMHDININDVESMQVLKDASASIYGVRGSNGVVVITTKKGKAGKSKISYDGWYGEQQPVKGFNLANSQQYANVLFDQLYNSGQNVDLTNGIGMWFGAGSYTTRNAPVLPNYLFPTGASTADPSLYDINSYQITQTNKNGTDWYGEIFKSAPITSHNISVSGGGDKSSYLFSFGYFNQQGTLINTYLKRYTARANTSFNVKDHIRMGENLSVFFRDNPTILNQNEGNAISMTYRIPALIPVYDIVGNYAGTKSFSVNNAANPVAQQKNQSNNKGNDWEIVGNGWAEADFLKHFTVRTNIGGTIDNYYYYNFSPTPYQNAEGNTTPNSFSEGSGFSSHWQWTNTLNYSNTFGEHSIKVLIGTEAHEYYYRSSSGSRSNYVVTNPSNLTVDPNTWTLNAGSPAGQTNSSVATWSALYSQFGKLDYSYADKYLLSGTLRRDGSSNFAPGQQFGIFPAVSAAWRVSREDFFKSVTFMDDLKLRASWGKMGALNNVPTTNQFDIYQAGPGNSYYDINGTSSSSTLGFYQSSLGNTQTTWEKDISTDIGLDATLLNNKLEFSFDWFKKSITGLLFQAPNIYTIYNGSTPYINIGDVQNTGYDISVTYHGKVNKDFKYNITGNISHYKNEITALPGSAGYVDSYSSGSSRIANFVRNQIGHPIGAFFGYQVIGLFQNWDDVNKSATQDQAAPGRFKYLDANGDKQINASDRVFFGNPNPKFSYGINLSASYKNFDFSTFLYGVSGNDVLNYTKYWTDFPQVFEGNVSINLVNNAAQLVNSAGSPTSINDPTAQVKNAGTTIPVIEKAANFSNSTVVNSYYLEKGSYLRMKSLMIGYSIESSMLKKIGVDKFRIYLQAANLFTITKYTGLDPELQTSSGTNGPTNNSNFGIDFGNYPSNQKNFILGVNLTF